MTSESTPQYAPRQYEVLLDILFNLESAIYRSECGVIVSADEWLRLIQSAQDVLESDAGLSAPAQKVLDLIQRAQETLAHHGGKAS